MVNSSVYALNTIGESSVDEVRAAQLTIVEYCLKEGVEGNEMSDLIAMVTPTHNVPITNVGKLDQP